MGKEKSKYRVEEYSHRWCVVSATGSRVGCYRTEDEAVMKMETYNGKLNPVKKPSIKFEKAEKPSKKKGK